MRAGLCPAPGRLEIADVPAPTVADGVVVRMRAVGICGSDVHTYLGHHPFRKPPVVLGHEAAGVVTATPPSEERVSVGDRVAIMPVLSCWDCPHCAGGLPHLCVRKRVPGFGWPGLLSEFAAAPARVLVPLADGISYGEGAMIEPVAVAWRAIALAAVAANRSVAVLGGGPIGGLVARLCQLHSVGRLLVTDVKEFNREFLRTLGIPFVVDPLQDDPAAIANSVTGGEGFDVVVIASGHPTCLSEALALCGRRGRIVVLPMFSGSITADLNPIVLKETIILGSTIYTPDDFAAAADLVNSRRLDARPFITETAPMSDAPRLLPALESGSEHIKLQFDPTR
jgi:2-desacetyl-2-hydroxyethyl bacteriochlorophyllide A dehydrogenase